MFLSWITAVKTLKGSMSANLLFWQNWELVVFWTMEKSAILSPMKGPMIPSPTKMRMNPGAN